MHSTRRGSPYGKRRGELPRLPRRPVVLPAVLSHLHQPSSALPRRPGVWLRRIPRPGGSSAGGASRRTRKGISVSYSSSEWRTVEPLARKAAEQALAHPDRRDLFLCHAWDDRRGCAAELDGLLRSHDATVWFSERDVGLGKPLLREIDRGLASSRIGIVLVTPAMLNTLKGQGIADKELSTLLATDRAKLMQAFAIPYGTGAWR